jgi:hypothetical protein
LKSRLAAKLRFARTHKFDLSGGNLTPPRALKKPHTYIALCEQRQTRLCIQYLPGPLSRVDVVDLDKYVDVAIEGDKPVVPFAHEGQGYACVTSQTLRRRVRVPGLSLNLDRDTHLLRYGRPQVHIDLRALY